MSKRKNEKYLNEIGSMLNNLVTPEQADSIMSQFTKKEPKGFTKGDIMTVREFKNLKKGDIVHHKYYDDDDHLRSDEFDIIETVYPDDVTTERGFSFPLDTDMSDDDKMENCDNCGWTFTLRNAIKK